MARILPASVPPTPQPRESGAPSARHIATLDAAGLLIDDRPIETYFAAKTDLLPPVMRNQLEVWLAVMIGGDTTAPRQRARDPPTVKVHIMDITPIVTACAQAGHQTLAEITAADVLAALSPSGSGRVWADIGLGSLFKALKARKLIFANPMRGKKSSKPQATVPCRWTPGSSDASWTHPSRRSLLPWPWSPSTP